LDRICERATSKDRHARTASALAFADALREARLAGAERSRAGPAGLIGAVLSVALVVVLAATLSTTPPPLPGGPSIPAAPGTQAAPPRAPAEDPERLLLRAERLLADPATIGSAAAVADRAIELARAKD